jgi:hypothetical protein
MLSCGSLTEIGSFDSKGKPFGLFLGPFRGPFFHQGLEWFLFVLFLSVLTFTHVSRSLYLGLIGYVENKPIGLCRLTHLQPLHYRPQQFLDFFPLPHGQGSLRPTFFPAIVGFGGFSNRIRSLTSSGLSGSNPIRYFQPCSSNVDVTSLNRASDCTLTTAGFFSVPNLAGFLAPNIRILFCASTLLRIVPISEIRFPIVSLFQLLAGLAI